MSSTSIISVFVALVAVAVVTFIDARLYRKVLAKLSAQELIIKNQQKQIEEHNKRIKDLEETAVRRGTSGRFLRQPTDTVISPKVSD